MNVENQVAKEQFKPTEGNAIKEVSNQVFDSLKPGDFQSIIKDSQKDAGGKLGASLPELELVDDAGKKPGKPVDGQFNGLKPLDTEGITKPGIKPGDKPTLDVKPGDKPTMDVKPGDELPHGPKPGDKHPLDVKPGDKPMDFKPGDKPENATESVKPIIKEDGKFPQNVEEKPGAETVKDELKPGSEENRTNHPAGRLEKTPEGAILWKEDSKEPEKGRVFDDSELRRGK